MIGRARGNIREINKTDMVLHFGSLVVRRVSIVAVGVTSVCIGLRGTYQFSFT